MKRKKLLSAALMVGACIAVNPAWGQDSQTDRMQDKAKPGTASKPGTPSGTGSNMGSTTDGMNKGSSTVGGESPTDRTQDNAKPGTTSGTGSNVGSTTDRMNKGSSTVGGESPTDRTQDNAKSGTASRPGSPEGMGNTNRGMMGRQDVKGVQEALRDKGFDPGPTDGVMGSQTRAALRSFQQSKNLRATGQLDADTAEQLGVRQGSGAMNKSGTMDRSSADKR